MIGHLESQCDAVQEWKRRQNKGSNRKNVGSVRIGAALKGKVTKNSLLKLTVQLNSHPIEFHLDSGAEANVINEEICADRTTKTAEDPG